MKELLKAWIARWTWWDTLRVVSSVLTTIILTLAWNINWLGTIVVCTAEIIWATTGYIDGREGK